MHQRRQADNFQKWSRGLIRYKEQYFQCKITCTMWNMQPNQTGTLKSEFALNLLYMASVTTYNVVFNVIFFVLNEICSWTKEAYSKMSLCWIYYTWLSSLCIEYFQRKILSTVWNIQTYHHHQTDILTREFALTLLYKMTIGMISENVFSHTTAHTHTHTYMYIHTRTHTHTHTCTCTRAHKYTH